jgi:two-component system response regulator
VRDGAEALEFIFATDRYAGRDVASGPKLILLDLKLPLVDGIEVLRQIKADEQACLTPVVVMTSSNEERDMVESYKLGVNSYIRKPVDFNQFTEAVRQLGYYWLLLNEIPPPNNLPRKITLPQLQCMPARRTRTYEPVLNGECCRRVPAHTLHHAG